MPTTHTYYTCDVCRKRFHDVKNATACEENHVARIKILEIRRLRWDNPKSDYPAEVWIKNLNVPGAKICQYMATNTVKDERAVLKNGT